MSRPSAVHFRSIATIKAACGTRETRFVLGSTTNWRHVTCKRCLLWAPSGIRRIGESPNER